MNHNSKLLSICLVAASVLFASGAEGHILVSPANRMAGRDDAKFIQNNPSTPGNPTIPTVADSPSPCSTYATPMATRLQLQPGQNFTFNVQETINHPGRFIVQFRLDPTVNFWTPGPANQLARVEDPLVRGTTPIPIVVPNTPCDNCMIRVLQQMDEQPGEFYVQCYDVRISASNPVATPPPAGTVGKLAEGDFKKPGFGCAMVADISKNPPGPGGTGFAALVTFALMLMPLVVAIQRRRQV